MNSPHESTNWEALSKLDELRSVIDSHDTKGSKNCLIDRIHWNAMRQHLKGTKNLLDFGCGIGRYAKRIKAMGIRYCGIDTSGGMVQKAIALNGSRDFDFKQFDGSKIPFGSESFDTVILSEVLTYILKTPLGPNTLAEIKRVLAPGGRLVMIEQASISNRKSESANEVLLENDYTHAIKKHFKIETLYKVRSPDFSTFTCRIIESPKVPLAIFRCLAGALAKHETELVNKASDDYFKTTSYYEFILEARVIKGNDTN